MWSLCVALWISLNDSVFQNASTMIVYNFIIKIKSVEWFVIVI